MPYCEYIWDNLGQHEHLPALVCGVSGRALLHGQVTPGVYHPDDAGGADAPPQVREKALRVSAALRGLGLAKGAVVAILLPNCLEYMLLVQVAARTIFCNLLCQ